MPAYAGDLVQVSLAWDVEELFASLFANEELVRAMAALLVDLIREYDPDVVVDSFGRFACLAARILQVPLASVLQGSFHPQSDGFLWWAGERPAGLPSAAPESNKVAAENGIAPVERTVDLLAGDLSLIVGMPETDPVSATANVTYIGPILWQHGDAVLPEWVGALGRDRPVVWVYSGNPRYAGVSTPVDSMRVLIPKSRPPDRPASKAMVGFARLFRPTYPGFPVEVRGVVALYAAFLNESRTRGHVWCWVTGIRFAGANVGHPSHVTNEIFLNETIPIFVQPCKASAGNDYRG